MRPGSRIRSEEEAEHDRRLVPSRNLLARISRREMNVLVRVGGVDLRPDEIPEVTDSAADAGALERRYSIPAIRIAAYQRDAGAERKPGERAVLGAEVIARLRDRDVRK